VNGIELPEQQPGRDFLESLALSVVSQVPIVGPLSVAGIESALKAKQRARDEEFLAFLSARVTQLEKASGTPRFDPSDDEFVASANKVFAASRETADQEKRALLAAALAEAGSWSSVPYDARVRLLDLVIRLTPWHIRVLIFFRDPSAWMIARGRSPRAYLDGYMMGGIDTVVSKELAADDPGLNAHLERIIGDLDRELLTQVPLGTTMSPSGMIAPRIKPLGRELLKFLGEAAG
jgi:hypothetical protein